MERNEKIQLILNTLPEKPGVYQHLNNEGEIIYVGKAKNLKRRVSSYFNKNNNSFKTEQLVKHIADIKYIVVESEQDAFLLENNLIKKYQPHYNILLKDGKSYPSICITKEEYPRVFKTRNINRKTGEYYGPYSFGYTLELILELIHQLYPIRTCNLKLTNENIEKNKYKVCLKYHIGNCCGICERKTDDETYKQYINQIRYIIRGNAASIQEQIRRKMIEYASDMQYEKAEEEKRKLQLIEKFISKTIITNTSIKHTIALGYEEENQIAYISILSVEKGSIVSADNILYKKKEEETKEEILSRTIDEIKEQRQDIKEIILPFEIEEQDDDTIKLTIPIKGDKQQLLQLAMQNAQQQKNNEERIEDKLNPDRKSQRILNSLKDKLKLDTLPYRIESFDNSNIQGTNAVAGCVVFENAKPKKSDYRKYIIQTVVGQDDYASMREIIYRRYKRIMEEKGTFPDLIIADGGVGQMHAIKEVLDHQLKINIPIAGLVKDQKHRTASMLYGFPPKEIGLKPTDELFHFLTRIQDEVHRFAITFHKQKRSKSQTHSELDEIKGIGKTTQQQLLKTFKSLKQIRSASIDELAKVVGKSRATIVYNYFNGKIS